MAKAVINLDKIGSDNHVICFKAHKELENGMIIGLNGLETGEREVYKAEDVKATSDTLIMVACVGLQYENGKDENEFSLKKGEIGRGYILRKGDMVTISDIGLEGGSTVGKYYVATATKQKLVQGEKKGDLELNLKGMVKSVLPNGDSGLTLEVI